MEEAKYPTQIQRIQPEVLEVHEEAYRIPEMSPDEWAEFIEDVKTRGMITDPVYALPDGRVFDGRHRLKAAKELGLRLIPVVFWEIDEIEALDRMSQSARLRRSLTPGQRAAIVVEFDELIKEIKKKAREKQLSRLKKGSEVPFTPIGVNGKVHTEVELAEKAGVGKGTISRVSYVKKYAPDLFPKIKSGEWTPNKAYNEAKKRLQQPEKEKSDLRKDEVAQKRVRKKLEAITNDITTNATKIPQKKDDEHELSPSNIVRQRATVRMPQFAREFVYDFESLQAADQESVDLYLKQLVSIVEGALLLLEIFERDERRRFLYQFAAKVFLTAKDDKELDEFITKMGGVLNEKQAI